MALHETDNHGQDGTVNQVSFAENSCGLSTHIKSKDLPHHLNKSQFDD